MDGVKELVGKYRHYLVAAAVMVVGLTVLYWPGRFGTDHANGILVTLGASLMVGGLGWGFVRLDRQVSNDPRYRTRPAYREGGDEDRTDPDRPA